MSDYGNSYVRLRSCYNGPELRTINEIVPRKAKLIIWVLTGHINIAIGSFFGWDPDGRMSFRWHDFLWMGQRNLNHQKKLVDLSPKGPTYVFFQHPNLVVHFAIIHSLNDVHDNPMNHGFSWENLNRKPSIFPWRSWCHGAFWLKYSPQPIRWKWQVQGTLRKDYAVAAQNLWDKDPGAWTGALSWSNRWVSIWRF